MDSVQITPNEALGLDPTRISTIQLTDGTEITIKRPEPEPVCTCKCTCKCTCPKEEEVCTCKCTCQKEEERCTCNLCPRCHKPKEEEIEEVQEEPLRCSCKKEEPPEERQTFRFQTKNRVRQTYDYATCPEGKVCQHCHKKIE